DGDQALELLRLHRPRLAVLDFRMPGRTGIQVVQAARSDPALAQTRFVLLTGSSDQVTHALAITAGVDVFLAKPFSPQELLEVVAQLLATGSAVSRTVQAVADSTSSGPSASALREPVAAILSYLELLEDEKVLADVEAIRRYIRL